MPTSKWEAYKNIQRSRRGACLPAVIAALFFALFMAFLWLYVTERDGMVLAALVMWGLICLGSILYVFRYWPSPDKNKHPEDTKDN